MRKQENALMLLDLIAEKKELLANDIDLLLELSNSNDSEIRAYVAELLVMGDGHRVQETLMNMCDDSDELVRVNACDSLSVFKNMDVYNRLVRCALEDKSILVKSYALMSIIDIMQFVDARKGSLIALFEKFIDDDSISIKIACFKGLYKLGNEEYLIKLLSLISSKDYHVRCSVINAIGDIVNKDTANIIVPFLKEHKKSERSQAVISTIDRIVCEIQSDECK